MSRRTDDHRAATRIAASVAAPALILVVTGHASWVIYAVFGAFTAMYGRREPHASRLRHQSKTAVLLVVGVAAGSFASLCSVDRYGLALMEVGLAFVGSIFADSVGLSPRGPFWLIFAFGACAMVPHPDASHVAGAVATTAATATWALAIGLVGAMRTRSPVSFPPRAGTRSLSLVDAAAYALAVGLAGTLSTAAGIGHPVWSLAAAAVPLAAAGLAERVSRGAHRLLGTLLGLVLAAALLFPFGIPNGFVAVVIVIALQLGTEFYMARHYGVALVFLTPLVLLMLLLARPASGSDLIVDRAVETAIGSAVGIAVAYGAHRVCLLVDRS